MNNNNEETVKSGNRMGTMPTGKLLFVMSTPMIISMLVQAMYNIIDSIFVAKISETALTAVSMAFPIQNLMIAVSAGTGVGINALLSRALGEGNKKDAQHAATNGIFLAILSSIVFIVFGIFAARLFYSSQSTNPEIIEYGTIYTSIVCIFSIGIFLEITLERIMQSTGKTIYNMYTQGIGAIINIIFDPILIFGLLGFPKLGIAGAAIATVAGQITAMLLALFFNHTKNEEVSISMKGFKPNKRIIALIYGVGIPSIIMQSITSFMVYGLNKILIVFSETAVTVLGIYFKLQSFVFMPVFGLNNGMIPIVAYNYGAGKKDRINSTTRYSIFAATAIMVAGTLAFVLIPRELLLMFNASDSLLSMGIPALRIISISFILAGFNIITTSTFQALGNGLYSLFVSVLRQIVIILPAAYILSHAFGLTASWFAFPIAEVVALGTDIFLYMRIRRKKIDVL